MFVISITPIKEHYNSVTPTSHSAILFSSNPMKTCMPILGENGKLNHLKNSIGSKNYGPLWYPELTNVLPLKPGVGQCFAHCQEFLHSPSFDHPSSFTSIFPNPLPIF